MDGSDARADDRSDFRRRVRVKVGNDTVHAIGEVQAHGEALLTPRIHFVRNQEITMSLQLNHAHSMRCDLCTDSTGALPLLSQHEFVETYFSVTCNTHLEYCDYTLATLNVLKKYSYASNPELN